MERKFDVESGFIHWDGVKFPVSSFPNMPEKMFQDFIDRVVEASQKLVERLENLSSEEYSRIGENLENQQIQYTLIRDELGKEEIRRKSLRVAA